jgi:hypothetical protein
MPLRARQATCHPERKHRAHGLCARCYQRRWANGRPHHRKEIYRRWELKALYGLSEADYHALIALKQGCCHLCGIKTEKLNVDHNHHTGKVRGMLCMRCNIALGWYEEVNALPNLQEYLNG